MSAFSQVPGGEVGRICDVCGVQRTMRRLRTVLLGNTHYLVCEKHPGWVPPEALEKLPTVTFGAPKPVKNARDFVPRDTFEADERVLFDFVARDTALSNEEFNLNAASVTAPTTTGSPRAVAWQGIYLYSVISEAQRPMEWVNTAKRRLKACAEWLLANMVAGPGVVTAFTNVDIEWGAFARSALTYAPHDSAAAGIALLRAYQVFADSRYLLGARACAWFVRSAQCGHLKTNRPSSIDSGGLLVKYWGAVPNRVVDVAGVPYFDHIFAPQGLQSAEFLTLYQSVVGNELIGSPTTNADFNGSRAALVSTCIADMKAFWASGVYSVLHNATITGFSTATPYQGFDSYPSDKGPAFSAGQGSWFHSDGYTNGTLIEIGNNWAYGVRAYYLMDGASSFVMGLFDLLAGAAVNTSFSLPTTTPGRMVSGYDDRMVWAGAQGPFDARYAPATSHKVRESNAWTNKAGTSFYDLAALGLMAELYSARQTRYFKAVKDSVAENRPRNVLDGGRISLLRLGRCGFSWQPYTDASLNRTASVLRAAQFGLIYRQQPKAALGRGIS